MPLIYTTLYLATTACCNIRRKKGGLGFQGNLTLWPIEGAGNGSHASSETFAEWL